MREVGREEERKRRWHLETDANKLVLHPDLLADLVSHQTGFIDSKLRTCVELCYCMLAVLICNL